MKSNIMVKCICSKCKTEAISVPGKQHRRCSGEKDKLRKKIEKLPGYERGTWKEIE